MRGANHRNCCRQRRASTNQPKLEVVVGFDSEWVDASHADDGIPPNASNRILSWQYLRHLDAVAFSHPDHNPDTGSYKTPQPVFSVVFGDDGSLSDFSTAQPPR